MQSMLMKLDEATRPAVGPAGGLGPGPARGAGLSVAQTTTPPPELAVPHPDHQSAGEGGSEAAAALDSAVHTAVLLADSLQGTAVQSQEPDGDRSARSTADLGEAVEEAAPRLTADFADDGEGTGPGVTMEVPVFTVSGVTLEVRPGTAASVPEPVPAEAGPRTSEQGEAWRGSLRLETAQGMVPVSLLP
jgi:hypothetical protein